MKNTLFVILTIFIVIIMFPTPSFALDLEYLRAVSKDKAQQNNLDFNLDWGHLNVVSEDEEARKNNLPSIFLLEKILNNETITYCLDGNLKLFPPRKLSSYLQAALKEWTQGSAKFIKKSENPALFSDILPILQRDVKIKLVSCADSKFFKDKPHAYKKGSNNKKYYGKSLERGIIPDLAIMVSSKCEKWLSLMNKRQGFYANRYYDIPEGLANNFICLGNEFVYHTLLHELGHAFGLSDQYKGSYDTDPDYSSEYDKKDMRGLWFLVLGSYIEPTTDSVMAADFLRNSISCDDADGLIALIDRFKEIKRGGSSGWLSMCRDRRYVYKDGAIITAVRYDKDGKIRLIVNNIAAYDFKENHNGNFKIDSFKENMPCGETLTYKKGQLTAYRNGDFHGKINETASSISFFVPSSKIMYEMPLNFSERYNYKIKAKSKEILPGSKEYMRLAEEGDNFINSEFSKCKYSVNDLINVIQTYATIDNFISATAPPGTEKQL